MVSNTWSRKARRQRAQNANSAKEEGKAAAKLSSEILFTFKFDIQEVDEDNVNVIATWTKGKQREVFESFWNHVKKRMLQDFGILQGDQYKPRMVDGWNIGLIKFWNFLHEMRLQHAGGVAVISKFSSPALYLNAAHIMYIN